MNFAAMCEGLDHTLQNASELALAALKTLL